MLAKLTLLSLLFSCSLSEIREYPKGLCPAGREDLRVVCRNYRASTNPIFTAFSFNDLCFRGSVKYVNGHGMVEIV